MLYVGTGRGKLRAVFRTRRTKRCTPTIILLDLTNIRRTSAHHGNIPQNKGRGTSTPSRPYVYKLTLAMDVTAATHEQRARTRIRVLVMLTRTRPNMAPTSSGKAVLAPLTA